jgi:excisionase family DNA binding protein
MEAAQKVEGAAPPLLYKLQDACAVLGGISEATLWRWIAAGEVESVRLGRRRMIKAASIERIVQHGTRAA